MLKKRVRLKTEELRLVNEILKTLTRYGELNRIFDKILQIFYSFWSIEAGFIALKESPEGRLRIHTAFGFLPSELERAIYSKGEGITGLTYQLGIPLYATEDELLNKTGLLQRLKGKKLVFFTAPIKVGDKVIGVLGLFLDEREVPYEVEKVLETLSVIGLILGTFIELKAKDELPINLTEEFLKNLSLGGELEGEYLFSLPSPAFRNILRLIDAVKNLPFPLLLVGEAGVGKSVLAKFIHLLSERKKKPFAVLDPREIPAGELEEKLLSAWEKSRGGTLLVKHLQTLPLEVQRLLLNLAKGPTRIMATCPAEPLEFYREGKLLPSLYRSFAVLKIEVPPLRERKEDIPPLVNFIFAKYRSGWNLETKISPEVVKLFEENPPRDNITGIERIVQRLLLIFGKKEVITLKDVELAAPELSGRERVEDLAFTGEKKFTHLLEEEEKRKIIEALERTNYVKSRAAKLLGYTLRQLDYRLKKYGIEVKKRK
jgi:Nif-specific regulatory protein